MKPNLNNTGIPLADLTDIEIKLAIELYKLAGARIDNDASAATRKKDSRFIGVFNNLVGYWYSCKIITLYQLAFESGLNPAEAIRIVKCGGSFAWELPCHEIKHIHGLDIESSLSVSRVIENPSWPTESRIDVIGQNGNDGIHYEEMSSLDMARDLATPKSASKYDIVVSDKFTGQKVTIDVYALLKAFPVRKSPEVEHSIKKLLAAGVRNGGKSYKQDIEEARNQLNLELDYLELMEGEND